MTEKVTVHNSGASDLTLPCGTRIPARKSAPVAVKALIAQAENPVVQHWFGDGRTGVLRAEGPLPGIGSGASGCACADVQARLAAWVETARRHAAERDAAHDALAAKDETIAGLTAERDAAHAAKADAEGLLVLAQEELTAKGGTDKATGDAAKPKGAKAS